MPQLEQMAEKVGLLMNAEVEIQGSVCLIKQIRSIRISAHSKQFNCMLEHDISFTNLKKDGTAYNQAEIVLLPEELEDFITALHHHSIPVPINYQYRVDTNPNILCVYLSSQEAPEDFAIRLLAAFEVIQQNSLVS
ncbi:DUF1259 domain-containing protein [Planococcus versutus]|uniref:DUF1259 domain-containing protein n=1 Tax=Planococcus versutus TaxID=1302659 RepID=A0A1B1S1E0_9BACL|nr:DUF1259 domain-containing protein [Planococcus versutus]ANU27017.1 hypothetical protein I858_008425 [Planococcus versutus]